MSGLVFDATLEERHEELRREVLRKHMEAVLDPRAMELGTIGGHTNKLAELEWGGKEPHRPEDLMGRAGNYFVDAIADRVVNQSYTAVLAPTHYLTGPDDAWLEIDRVLTRRLRNQLDAAQHFETLIYYPLGISNTVLHDQAKRQALVSALQSLPIDAVWLRVHPFGVNAGPHSIRNYIESCRDLHRLKRPIVGEKTGTIGLALLAFSAVGGIESGVTMGERFDASSWLRPRNNSVGFLRPPRVYIPRLGVFLERKQAEAFLASPQMKGAFACHNPSCCKKGARDMLADPRHHFLITRMGEVRRLGNQPETIRPNLYMDEFLRPATDLVLRAARSAPNEMASIFERLQRKLESRRVMLGQMASLPPGTTFPMLPERRRIGMLRGA
jgi:hypothetical protein